MILMEAGFFEEERSFGEGIELGNQPFFGLRKIQRHAVVSVPWAAGAAS